MIRRLLIGATTVVVLAIPASAGAAGAAGEFGQHVQQCAQTIGFNGEHNPGMHAGHHGWSPDHTCEAT